MADAFNLSRMESILESTLGHEGGGQTPTPQSRVEELLIELKEAIEAGGGGGGGITSYAALTNKPSINNVTLQGNKTLEQLGVVDYGDAVETLMKDETGNLIALSNLFDNRRSNAFVCTLDQETNENVVTTTFDDIVIRVNVFDGSLTISGTPLIDSYWLDYPELIVGRSYALSGAPSDGSVALAVYGSYKGEGRLLGRDIGEGAIINIDSDASDAGFGVCIEVTPGKTLDRVALTPILRPTIYSDDVFVPGAASNAELTLQTRYDSCRLNVIGDALDDLDDIPEAVTAIVDSRGKNVLISNVQIVGTSSSQEYHRYTLQDDGGILIEGISEGEFLPSIFDRYTIFNRQDFGHSGVDMTLSEDEGEWIATLQCDDTLSSKGAYVLELIMYDDSTGTASDLEVRAAGAKLIHGRVIRADLKVFGYASIPEGGVVVYPMICRRAFYDFSNKVVAPAISVEDKVKRLAYTGSKNLLRCDAVGKTENGVTVVVNTDDSITVDGTTTKLTFVPISVSVSVPAETILSGCPEGVTQEMCELRIGSGSYQYSDTGKGVVITTDLTDVAVRIVLREGQTFNNVTFYPMIRPAEFMDDDTYVPYAPTNRELYELYRELLNSSSSAKAAQAASLASTLSIDELGEGQQVSESRDGVDDPSAFDFFGEGDA